MITNIWIYLIIHCIIMHNITLDLNLIRGMLINDTFELILILFFFE